MTAFRIILWSFQIAAFIAAILYWGEYKNSTQRNFIYFLGYVLLTEFLGYAVPIRYNISSQFIYNIFTLISFPFYFYWFYRILESKKTIIVFISIFFISVIIAFIYEDFWSVLWKIPLTTGTVLILFCATLFYKELLFRKEVINFLESQPFWIVTGLLIFYIGFLPVQLLQEFVYSGSKGYYFAIMILNILLYGCFLISFLCLKKK